MESLQDQSLKQSLPADDSDSPFQLYTIPSHSSWFVWDDIHETEKVSLKEFFDFSSVTRTPKIYKEYRDFIISKFREDPSRRLTFSEVRRSLVGDVSYLYKVFLFLEKWGLINFGVSSGTAVVEDDDLVWEEEKGKVKVEEGPPHGVRVVALPNSLKPVSLPPSGSGSDFRRSDFKMPPLASHINVFDEVNEQKKKGMVCGNCEAQCDSGHYESTKEESLIICMKCFQNGNYGKNKSVEDFKLVDCNTNGGNRGPEWTEAETLLLLESVLKHGDDWELVAQSLGTKSKLDCISKLIQLPFGELMLGSAYDRCRYWETINNSNGVKQGKAGLAVSLNTGKTENRQCAITDGQENGDSESQGPPLKKICVAPISNVCSSPMEQTDQENPHSPLASAVREETVETAGEPGELNSGSQQNGEVENQSPQPKGVSRASFMDVCSSLMNQVARISTMVGPEVAASAAEGAVTAICNENFFPREIFEEEHDDVLGSSTQTNEIESTTHGDDSEVDGRPSHSETWETSSEKRTLPIALRVRAATATALGAAAARAKLLAVQEDREVEHLVATIIDAQMKKLQYKMKLVEELEVIMEKEYSQLEELEECLLTERMDVIERVFDAGISRLRNHSSLRPPHTGGTAV